MILFLQVLFSAVAWIGISLWTVFWTSLMAVVYLVHPLADPQRRILHRMASIWGRGLLGCVVGYRVELSGLEHIPPMRPVIFMANHQSYMDVPALFSLPGQLRWMADEGLFRIPVFGWAMRMAGYVPVHRGDAREGIRSLDRAKRLLEQGLSIFIFPEGTRSHSGLFGRFQTGGFRLAVATGTPIVPVVVVGTRQLLPRGTVIFRWRVRVRICILAPITPSRDRKSTRALAGQVSAQMKKGYLESLKTARITFT